MYTYLSLYTHLFFFLFFFFFFFKHGVSLYIQDKEGLSALDLLMKDRPTHVVFKNTGKEIPQIYSVKVQPRKF